MAVSVSVSSRTSSQKKSIWAWAVSEKNNKFGSASTESPAVGNLLATHSVLLAIPEGMDVIIRTQLKSVVDILNSPEKDTKNPVVKAIFQIINARSGKVTAVVVTQAAVNENDRRAYKMTSMISGGGSAPKKKPSAGSFLSPAKKTTVKVTRSTAPKKRRVTEVLITGLEDDYDTPVASVKQPATGKPVLCESCDGPINPLTFECFCSA